MQSKHCMQPAGAGKGKDKALSMTEESLPVWRAFVARRAEALGLDAGDLAGLQDDRKLADFCEGFEYGSQGAAALIACAIDRGLKDAPDATVHALDCDGCEYVGIYATALYPWEAAEFASRFPADLKDRFESACLAVLAEFGVEDADGATGEWNDTVSG